MSKSFISILGTNNYLECLHSFNGFISQRPVKYVQEDLIKFFCKDFDEHSEIRIFLTKEAKEKNWLNDGHRNKNNNVLHNKGLEDRLTELNIKAKIKAIDINEGFTEKEIWDNFQKIYDTISENEEVIVDITHSFRSLPMLLITLLNYAKQLKKIKVLGIYYAAFESLGTIQEVSKKEPEERIVPILDLTSFSTLQDWTNATFDFINNGNIQKLQNLIKQLNIKINSNIPSEKHLPDTVIKKLNKLVHNIALCRGKELLDFDYDDLKNNVLSLKSKVTLPAFEYLIEEIENKIKSFNNEVSDLILTIIQWCIEHNLFQQAITILQEFTITLVLKDVNKEFSDKTFRTLVSQAFSIKASNIGKEEWKEPAKNYQAEIENLLNNYYVIELYSHFNSLTSIRNDVNHSGFLCGASTTESIKCRLKNIIESYQKILANNAHQSL